MKRLFIIIIMLSTLGQLSLSQEIAQWRGPDRNGVFPESGLLKSWPQAGPDLLWSAEGLGDGYASVTVKNGLIYVTGRDGTEEYLSVFDTKGQLKWRIPYGNCVRRTYKGTRCTPAVEGQYVYLISGRGEVVCVDKKDRNVKWSVPAFEKFQGKSWEWEIAESPLIVDDKIVFTPGGHLTSMVAFDKRNGDVVWQTKSLQDTVAMVSPALIQIDGKKIIVNVMINYIFGVDAENGDILWKVKYSDIEPPMDHPWKPHNNCIMPLYHDGSLFITSGYDHVAVMFTLSDKGRKIKQKWINRTLDCHHGHVVRIGNYIYGANWLDNRDGNWCCVDWNTGETMYEKHWENKGSVSAADGMLYCYEEKRGNIALVEPTSEDFKIVSSFRITQGRGPHWTQPVIANGVLYMRHGDVLMAYDIKVKD